jgi:hypothetical protein
MRSKRIDGTPEERFWAKVQKSDGCWEWLACKTRTGYGHFAINGRYMSAHRTSWLMCNGDPGDKHVLHTCDNPGCVNPAHLFLGTHADNMRDREQKGRANHPIGNTSGVMKLRDEYVPVLKFIYALSACDQRDLAHAFGVSKQLVSWVVNGGRDRRHIKVAK